MFDLKRPCHNCPFRKSVGERFALREDRLRDIVNGVAFQCHQTVNYDEFDDPEKRSGNHPQQCAGLMSLLHREGFPNQIMQVAERLAGFDASKLEHADVYETIDDAFESHTGKKYRRRKGRAA